MGGRLLPPNAPSPQRHSCRHHAQQGGCPMIEARGLVKRYGATAAVNDLNFTIRPGLVTGFLGPDGTGQTTTVRLILSLDYPAAGSVQRCSRWSAWPR
jgi:ABC-type multidrug transport system ATPase subunit